MNLYLYGRASPVVMVDPNGMEDRHAVIEGEAPPPDPRPRISMDPANPPTKEQVEEYVRETFKGFGESSKLKALPADAESTARSEAVRKEVAGFSEKMSGYASGVAFSIIPFSWSAQFPNGGPTGRRDFDIAFGAGMATGGAFEIFAGGGMMGGGVAAAPAGGVGVPVAVAGGGLAIEGVFDVLRGFQISMSSISKPPDAEGGGAPAGSPYRRPGANPDPISETQVTEAEKRLVDLERQRNVARQEALDATQEGGPALRDAKRQLDEAETAYENAMKELDYLKRMRGQGQ